MFQKLGRLQNQISISLFSSLLKFRHFTKLKQDFHGRLGVFSIRLHSLWQCQRHLHRIVFLTRVCRRRREGAICWRGEEKGKRRKGPSYSILSLWRQPLLHKKMHAAHYEKEWPMRGHQISREATALGHCAQTIGHANRLGVRTESTDDIKFMT